MTVPTSPNSGSLARGLFYAGVLTVPLLNLRLVGENVTISDALFGVSLIVAVLFGQRSPSGPSGARQIAGYLCLLGGVIAGFNAMALGDHFADVARLLFILMVWPWLALTVLVSRAHVERAAACWIAGAAMFALVVLYQGRFQPEMFDAGRVSGLAGHVTDAGGILSIAFPAVLGYLVTGGHKILAGVLLGVIGAALILTGSVSGYLTALLGSLALIVVLRRGLRSRAVLMGTALAAIVVTVASKLQQESGLGISIWSRFESTTSGQYDTFDYRMQTFTYALERLAEQPLIGVGFDPVSGVTVMGYEVHNLLLVAWYEGGLLVLAGVMVFLIHVLRAARSIPAGDVLAQRLKAAAFAAFAFSMTSPLLAQRYLWLPALLLLALAYSRASGAQRQPVPVGRRVAGRWVRLRPPSGSPAAPRRSQTTPST